jgi:hypothetical protein
LALQFSQLQLEPQVQPAPDEVQLYYMSTIQFFRGNNSNLRASIIFVTGTSHIDLTVLNNGYKEEEKKKNRKKTWIYIN